MTKTRTEPRAYDRPNTNDSLISDSSHFVELCQEYGFRCRIAFEVSGYAVQVLRSESKSGAGRRTIVSITDDSKQNKALQVLILELH